MTTKKRANMKETKRYTRGNSIISVSEPTNTSCSMILQHGAVVDHTWGMERTLSAGNRDGGTSEYHTIKSGIFHCVVSKLHSSSLDTVESFVISLTFYLREPRVIAAQEALLHEQPTSAKKVTRYTVSKS